MSTPEQLRERTKKFALRVIRLFQALPKTAEAQVLGKQLLLAGHPLQLIIVRRAVGDLKLNLLQDWELLLKKRMKVFSGWSCSKKQTSSSMRGLQKL